LRRLVDIFTMYPNYPIPWLPALQVIWSALLKRPRSFRQDAGRIIARAEIPLHVRGSEHIPCQGPALITFNHYHRPGFGAWWLALAIGSLVPAEMHWTMTAAWTAAWTETGEPAAKLRAAISRWLFPRLANIYGFTAMPPMPPRPFEVEARARAVRQVLRAARLQPPPVIAVAPEGMDMPGGVLACPLPGVGRFLLHLGRLGYPIHPLGAYEEARALCLSFGPPFALEIPPGLAAEAADRQAAHAVMQAIARQLPARLRGEFNQF
jgi:hypothetical protein